MDLNYSIGGFSSTEIGAVSVFVQVLISLFLIINSILIATFFMKDIFYTNMRYILFVTVLLSDSLILITSNVLLIMTCVRFPVQMWICAIIVFTSVMYTFVTPFTLTAMSVERYIAICMPLRHADLCVPRRALHCILIVHCISCIPSFISLSNFMSLVHFSIYTDYRICSVEQFIVQNWHDQVRSAVKLMYFSTMIITIVICYVKIMKVAKSASGKNKQAMWKGTRTVLLHAIQLLLCLSQMWCPIVESAALKIDLQLYIYLRFFNYIIFILCPRCLSPLIYGLRDEKFLLALKSYLACGSVNNKALKNQNFKCTHVVHLGDMNVPYLFKKSSNE